MLHDGDGFCCLGVAEDVLRDGWWVEEQHSFWSIAEEVIGLTWATRDMLGMSHEDVDALTCMNDGGSTFPAIARYIREELAPDAFEDSDDA